ncbi:hypothetical protein VZ95_03705 [Elstera litoralis]|uniref:Uncharacterized protein n=1 Tax=Elstera litoralis TaxID=552518 RepID=A0A0F3IYE4_9PROT|nr:hypothetical protein [Elstera litoralis]KJV10614.1 hypothetical protein VZ95_03705 [Elstera litoralis]
MTHRIDIQDATAERLARLQALTGQDVDSVLNAALQAQLIELEDRALRAAVQCGVDEANAGIFSSRSLDEIFAQGIEQARQPRQG